MPSDTPQTTPAPCQGAAFMQCQEPSETVYQGVRCEACGAIMSAQEWDAIERQEGKT